MTTPPIWSGDMETTQTNKLLGRLGLTREDFLMILKNTIAGGTGIDIEPMYDFVTGQIVLVAEPPAGASGGGLTEEDVRNIISDSESWRND